MCWRDLGWIPRAASGGFRAEVYGFCGGDLSRSRLNVSLLKKQEIGVGGPKPWLADKADYVRDGDFTLANGTSFKAF